MEKCPMYEQGNAAERLYFGKNIVVCKVKPQGCPYKNSEEISYGGEIIGNMCKTRGLVELVWKHPGLDIQIKENPEFIIKKRSKLPVELI